jgi:hypothetical protein
MCAPRAREDSLHSRRLIGASARSLNFTVEVAMEQSGSAPSLTARTRRLRIYRLLANSWVPLLAIALSVLVLRWVVPQLFPVLVVIWTADASLIVLLVIPWLLVSWAFSSGAIKCPSCDAPFASKFHLWVPKSCQNCGQVAALKSGATSNNRSRGP